MSDDKIYSKKIERIKDFTFDEQVAEVFSDMLTRSIPAYRELLILLKLIADQYYQPGTRCYDLGCSLGAVSIALAERISTVHTDCFEIIAVDNSAPMLSRCQEHIEAAGYGHQIKAKLADVASIKVRDASIVVLNFTLQFVRPEKKQAVIEAIYQGLRSGGCLVISEKIVSDQDQITQAQEQLYYRFKRLNGYSELEIQQKKQALASVLFTESADQLKSRLNQAGFSCVFSWFQCLQFESYCAIK